MKISRFRLATILDSIINSGFYFASQVNIFDQVKCFHCDATFYCDIFGDSGLTDIMAIHRIHIQQNDKCTFLIYLIGAVQFKFLMNQPVYRVITRTDPASPQPISRQGLGQIFMSFFLKNKIF